MADRLDLLAFDSMKYATADKTAVDLLGDKAEVTKDDVHNMLMVAGFTPALGNIADAADAVLYAAEGEFGSAALSAAAMIPFIGQAVSAKRALKIAKESGEKMKTMYRGVDKWHRGAMVEKGKFVGGGDYYIREKALWATEDIDLALKFAKEEGEGVGVLLEFEIPESYFKENFKNLVDLVPGATRVPGKEAGMFPKGLPKEFLKKVHK